MTPPQFLETLFCNFHAIYAAAASGEELSLYSLDATTIFQATGVRRVLPNALNTFADAIQLTASTYAHLQEEWLLPHLKSYKKHLDAIRHGSEDIKYENQQAGVRIQEWVQKTQVFVDYVESKANPKLNKLLDENLPKDTFSQKYKEQSVSYAAISRLEALSRIPLPLQDWLLMTFFQAQQSAYPRHEKWINKLMNNEVDEVTHMDLYKGLEGAAWYFQSLDLECKETAVTILYSFQKHGYSSFLSQSDSLHIKWRNELSIGSSLGKKYRITGIYPELKGDSQKKVVQLDDSRYVARIFQNRILPFVYPYALSVVKLELPILKIVEIDPEGRFVIQERIDDPMSNLDLSGVSTISEVDKKSLQTPIQIMKYFIDKGWCPSIPLTYFRVTAEGGLGALKPYDKHAFWLQPFENYALEISRDNPIIYKYLIKAIGIQKLKIFYCYREATDSFAQGKEDYLSQALVSENLKGYYLDWKRDMRKLYENIQEVRKRTMQRYALERNTTLDPKKLEKAIMSYYDTSCSIAQLYKGAEEAIFKLVSV